MSRPRVAELVLLAVVLAFGASLRFDELGGPSYWLDEILGDQLTSGALAQPWWHWVTGLEREHGPLYYATQAVARVGGRGEGAGRFPAALFGLLTIPLVWLAARRTAGPVAGLVCAVLLAVSPLHVYYSREARPYALLMLLTAAALALLLRGGRAVVWTLAGLLYTSAVAAPVVAAIAVAGWLRGKWVAMGGAIALALFAALYRGTPGASAVAAFPKMDAAFFAGLARAFTVSALGAEGRTRTIVAMLVFAVVGAVALARRDRRTAGVVVAMTVLPVALPLVLLRFFGHWFAVRYVSPALPGFLVLVAAGMVAVATLVGRRVTFIAPLAILMAVLTAGETWRVARREAFQKLDWRAIAGMLREHVQPGDLILTAEPWSDVSLRYYLHDLPPRIRIGQSQRAEAAEVATMRAAASWLVTAGYSADPTVRGWMCGYPLLLASPLEDFRLHYAPSAAHFLAHRTGPAELHAAANALGASGFTLEMRSDDGLLLGDGWADAEGTGRDAFRWAVAREASVPIPRGAPKDRVIRMRMLVLPGQTVSLALNGQSLAPVPVTRGWSEYTIAAAASYWRDGRNTLTFHFATLTVPAELDPTSTDRRSLAAAIDWLSIADTRVIAPPAPDRPPIPTLRLGANRFLDASTAWRDREAPIRFPSDQLRAEEVTSLLARLGYAPAPVARLDDIIESVAYGSDCEDPRTFLHRAFAVLLERPPSPFEEQDLLAAMHDGWTRPRIALRIARSEEFRKRLGLYKSGG